jgi:hypothetical protein
MEKGFEKEDGRKRCNTWRGFGGGDVRRAKN